MCVHPDTGFTHTNVCTHTLEYPSKFESHRPRVPLAPHARSTSTAVHTLECIHRNIHFIPCFIHLARTARIRHAAKVRTRVLEYSVQHSTLKVFRLARETRTFRNQSPQAAGAQQSRSRPAEPPRAAAGRRACLRRCTQSTLRDQELSSRDQELRQRHAGQQLLQQLLTHIIIWRASSTGCVYTIEHIGLNM
jgi:hypothetical protein